MSISLHAFDVHAVVGDSLTRLVNNLSNNPYIVGTWAAINANYSGGIARAVTRASLGRANISMAAQTVQGGVDNGRPAFHVTGVDGLEAGGLNPGNSAAANPVNISVYPYNPHIVWICIGTNDAIDGVSTGTFVSNVTAVRAALVANCPRLRQIVWLTCAVHGEDIPNSFDSVLDANAAVLVSFAAGVGDTCFDLRTYFKALEAANNPGHAPSGVYTADGTHWNTAGAQKVTDLIATQIVYI